MADSSDVINSGSEKQSGKRRIGGWLIFLCLSLIILRGLALSKRLKHVLKC